MHETGSGKSSECQVELKEANGEQKKEDCDKVDGHVAERSARPSSKFQTYRKKQCLLSPENLKGWKKCPRATVLVL